MYNYLLLEDVGDHLVTNYINTITDNIYRVQDKLYSLSQTKKKATILGLASAAILIFSILLKTEVIKITSQPNTLKKIATIPLVLSLVSIFVACYLILTDKNRRKKKELVTESEKKFDIGVIDANDSALNSLVQSTLSSIDARMGKDMMSILYRIRVTYENIIPNLLVPFLFTRENISDSFISAVHDRINKDVEDIRLVMSKVEVLGKELVSKASSSEKAIKDFVGRALDDLFEVKGILKTLLTSFRKNIVYHKIKELKEQVVLRQPFVVNEFLSRFSSRFYLTFFTKVSHFISKARVSTNTILLLAHKKLPSISDDSSFIFSPPPTRHIIQDVIDRVGSLVSDIVSTHFEIGTLMIKTSSRQSKSHTFKGSGGKSVSGPKTDSPTKEVKKEAESFFTKFKNWLKKVWDKVVNYFWDKIKGRPTLKGIITVVVATAIVIAIIVILRKRKKQEEGEFDYNDLASNMKGLGKRIWDSISTPQGAIIGTFLVLGLSIGVYAITKS